VRAWRTTTSALVVRAPDNVLYLSKFLPMKGLWVRKVGQAGVAVFVASSRTLGLKLARL
jgi:hypothetical protein